jgi:hypothetical protein
VIGLAEDKIVNCFHAVSVKVVKFSYKVRGMSVLESEISSPVIELQKAFQGLVWRGAGRSSPSQIYVIALCGRIDLNDASH